MEEFCWLRARELLEELNINEPPVDVVYIAGSCGLKIEYVNRGKGFFGQLLRESRVIEVQENVHPHRQRFTIAHELAHYVLKHNPVSSFVYSESTDDPRRINESQAGIFASELLMPESWVKQYWVELRKDFRKTAQKFYVSEEAMFRRLDSLQLLGLEPPL